jgi:hypothetical protein
MITKNRPADIENPVNTSNSARNYLAGLLLVGSVVFSSPNMLKAAERYLVNSGQKIEGDTEQMAVELYSKFEKNLKHEFGGNKNLMLEYLLLGQESDVTVEGRKAYEKEIRGRFGDALKRTLKQSGIYKGLKANLEDGLRSRFLGEEADEGNDSIERNVAKENYGEKSCLLGAERMNTGINVSLGSGEINVSGSLTLEDFGLGMLRVDRGKFVCGNQGLKLELEKRVISDEIYSAFFRLKDFEDLRIDAGVNWSYGDPRKGIGALSAGIECNSERDAKGKRDTEVLGLISLTKYLN